MTTRRRSLRKGHLWFAADSWAWECHWDSSWVSLGIELQIWKTLTCYLDQLERGNNDKIEEKLALVRTIQAPLQSCGCQVCQGICKSSSNMLASAHHDVEHVSQISVALFCSCRSPGALVEGCKGGLCVEVVEMAML